MQNDKNKLKKIYAIFSTILIILFIMITFPPIVSAFDRNDIWIGPMPLSQFYVFIIPLLAGITMAILYYFDKKYSSGGKDEGGNQ